MATLDLNDKKSTDALFIGDTKGVQIQVTASEWHSHGINEKWTYIIL